MESLIILNVYNIHYLLASNSLQSFMKHGILQFYRETVSFSVFFFPPNSWSTDVLKGFSDLL